MHRLLIISLIVILGISTLSSSTNPGADDLRVSPETTGNEFEDRFDDGVLDPGWIITQQDSGVIIGEIGGVLSATYPNHHAPYDQPIDDWHFGRIQRAVNVTIGTIIEIDLGFDFISSAYYGSVGIWGRETDGSQSFFARVVDGSASTQAYVQLEGYDSDENSLGPYAGNSNLLAGNASVKIEWTSNNAITITMTDSFGVDHIQSYSGIGDTNTIELAFWLHQSVSHTSQYFSYDNYRLIEPISTTYNFQDNFDDSVFNTSVWTFEGDTTLNFAEENGKANIYYSGGGSAWQYCSIYKSFSPAVGSNVEVDFGYDFLSKMGYIGLFLVNVDRSRSSVKLQLHDAWTGTNAKALISSTDSDGTSIYSWESNKLATSGGNGHVSIDFASATSATFTFTYPGGEKVTQISGFDDVGYVNLFVGANAGYYDQNQVWNFDNYTEISTTPSPPPTITTTSPPTTTTTSPPTTTTTISLPTTTTTISLPTTTTTTSSPATTSSFPTTTITTISPPPTTTMTSPPPTTTTTNPPITITSDPLTLDASKVGIHKGDEFTYLILSNNMADNPYTNDISFNPGENVIITLQQEPNSNHEITMNLASGDEDIFLRDVMNDFGQIFLYTDWGYWEQEISTLDVLGDAISPIYADDVVTTINNGVTEFTFAQSFSGTIGETYIELVLQWTYDKTTGALAYINFKTIVDSETEQFEMELVEINTNITSDGPGLSLPYPFLSGIFFFVSVIIIRKRLE
ncbi:MAG: hypothetical protein ACXAD7_20760 [Candidatus Kariarchaeaceae archaeon]